MIDKNGQDIWERREDETPFWYARFLLFLDAGPARKLLTTVHRAELLENEIREKAAKGAKRLSIATPGSWQREYNTRKWRERANAYDEEQERLALAETKYARISERVKLLEKWVGTQDAIMVESVADKGYVRADTLEQLRGLLDDIAKETGGRVKVSKANLEHTGKDGGPIETSTDREALRKKLAAIRASMSVKQDEEPL